MKNFINYLLIISLCSAIHSCGLPKASTRSAIPSVVRDFVKNIEVETLDGNIFQVEYQSMGKGVVKVRLSTNLPATVEQDDWQVNITPQFKGDFHWAPHLTPTDEHIIAQHVFRAPALIVAGEGKQLTIVPDLDVLQKHNGADWYMDLDAPTNILTLGMSLSQVREHILFTKAQGAVHPAGQVVFSFYILTDKYSRDLKNPWRDVLSFFWNKWGSELYRAGEPLRYRNIEPYVSHVYNWAFSSWKDQVWQEFDLNGRAVGAPTFIVNVTQSPNYPGSVNEREFRSIWNQAWFNSLRSAQGLYRYAVRHNSDDLKKYALKTKELALSFPQEKGFFPGLIATEMEQVTVDGRQVNRSKGWDTYYFGNSNRNPYTSDPRQSPYHILDMSFTAWLMLTWYDELEKDQRLLDYARNYADALLSIQQADGFFPGWLARETYAPMQHLNESPESAMSTTFLLRLHALTGVEKYKTAAFRTMDAVAKYIIPVGQWEDFETYWSCSRYGEHDLVGKKVSRNNMFKQNTFSMYWTAQALLEAYKSSGDSNYLELGQRTIDELLMAQAVWQPPFIHVRALGGFGVMNADGEWNDSRQSLFAELILDYGKELNNQEYTQRGLAALRASFVMMYCPENPETMVQWQKAWPFFGKEDYGFMMENYGHGGVTSGEGLGIGEFTIYDWGNGAAAEAYNRIVDHYGVEFIQNN